MATTNIELDIENITGVSDADDQFIISAQKFVASSIPKELLRWASSETVPSTHGGDNDPQQVTIPTGTDSIISVRRDSYVAEEVGIEDRGFIDSSASLKKATNTFPKYFVADANRIIVKPDPDSTYKIYVTYIDYSNIDDDSDLRNAVVFHAAAQEFSRLSTDETEPTYIAPVMEAKTSFTDFSSGLSETDPGVFSLSAVQPTAPADPSFSTPTISAITIDALPSAPNYTAPVVGGDATELSSLDDLDTDNTIDEHADQPEWDQWFATAAHFIEDEEDTELASIQIQKINSYINAYSQAMQNQLNIFNEGNAVYQAAIQRNIQQAQINAQDAQNEANLLLQKENQEYVAKLQKYSSNLNKYQADVSKEVQEYQQKLSQYQLELSTSVQAWQKEETDKVSRYQSKVQNNMNAYNKENAIFNQNVQSYERSSEKYYNWAKTEVTSYIQNNSKFINRTMAAQRREQRQQARR
jgi:hypothetical protein